MGAESADLSPGTILCDRYEMLAVLGSGGMGVVYRARHLQLGHEVAIKVIGNLQKAGLKARFVREAQLASRVQHPHTVYVTDFGQLPDGGFFLVMELLSGCTLAAALAESGRMEPLRVCQLGAMIASGMQSVHEQGIVHRDLKPSNIFLTDHHGRNGARDYVKILDFGVAKEVVSSDTVDGTLDEPPTSTGDGSQTDPGESRAALTRAGGMVGTPRYMSPEQLRGEPVDARADQYSLGCTLYELLIGAPPYAGDIRAVTLGHLYGDLVPPRRLRSAISTELEGIVLRAMARRREGRFADMQTLAAALQAEAARLERRQRFPSLPWRYAVGVTAFLVVAGGTLRLVSLKQLPPHEKPTVIKTDERPIPVPPAIALPVAAAPTPKAAPSASETAVHAPVLVVPPVASAAPAQPSASRPASTAPPSTEPAAAVATISQLLSRATTALSRNDNRTAQPLLQSIRRRCGGGHRVGTECALALPRVSLELGRMQEAQGRLPEALAEYTRVLASISASSLRAADLQLRRVAHEGTARLLPQLGRVVVARPRGDGCEEVPMFLLPGEHRIEVNGERLLVSVKARETRRIGSCPSL